MRFCKQVVQNNLFAYILKSYPNSVLERKKKKAHPIPNKARNNKARFIK